MKAIYLIFTFYLCFLTTNIIVFAQCNENIILTTQDDIDNFATNYGCTEINGNLTIAEPLYSNTITNLLGLSNITSIEDTLRIIGTDKLENIDGLNKLTYIGGSLMIGGNSNNYSIVNIDGLSELTYIGGSLRITANHSLVNIDGLSKLTYVGDDIYISSNDDLLNVDGLSGVTSVGRNLIIGYNDSLLNLDGLSEVTSIGKVLHLRENASLIDLNGLNGITSVGAGLLIDDNNALLNLNGLNGLISIGGLLRIHKNASLLDINALSEITSVWQIWISSNPLLLNIDGLSGLTSVGNFIDIWGNAALLNIDGLSGLTSIEGILKITDNDAMLNVDGLSNITSVEEYLQIAYNASLLNLYGLSRLTSIGGDLSIGGEITWEGNASLINIDGLSSLNSIGGDLKITNNSVLSSCCIVTDLDIITQGTTEVSDNAAGCSSFGDIVESCNFSILSVQAFYDDNENSLQDGNEQVLYNLPFTINPPTSFYINNQNGSINFYTSKLGTYTIQYDNETNNLWQPVNGIDSYAVEITEQLDTIFYFPIQPVTDFSSQQIDVSSSITRCNQQTNVWVTYASQSSEPTNGYVSLVANESATLVSADPPFDFISGDTLFWEYQNLYPTHSNQIHLLYQMPDVDFIAENLRFDAWIKTDEDTGRNKSTYISELVCAYDPNDKLVTPKGTGNENYTLFEDNLFNYTVRFQNTGNDTAFNVIIKDVLSDHLDISTYQFITSSHEVITDIDRSKHALTFSFNDINLPDSIVNEPASHGFVKFSIESRNNLSENTAIENTASIFFDYNPPIVTNTTQNLMVSSLPFGTGLQEIRQKPNFTTYPNPNTGQFIFKIDKGNIKGFKLYNSTGKLIQAQRVNTSKTTIQINANPGIYFLSIETMKDVWVEKVVIHK